MKYIIPKFNAFVLNGNENDLTELHKDVCYCVDKLEKFVLARSNGTGLFVCDLKVENSFVEKIKIKSDEYYLINSEFNNFDGFFMFKYNGKQVVVSIFNNLIIAIEGETVVNEMVTGIKYSHFEIKNQMCFIYFCGERNYVVVLNGGNKEFASYYDEVNIKNDEIYFMCRLHDSLNHGRVFHINNKKVENYLVYLDDFDLNLKPDFVGCVFLDCVLAGNLKYANNLLCVDLKQNEAVNISKFFNEFDNYIVVDKNNFILLNKNTLAGIYSFELKDCEIANIIQFD